MHIHRFDKSRSPSIQNRRLPGADALLEFYSEERTPVRPAAVPAAPRIHETRRGNLAPVARAVRVFTTARRIEVPSFLWGAVCGALCLIAVYWLTL